MRTFIAVAANDWNAELDEPKDTSVVVLVKDLKEFTSFVELIGNKITGVLVCDTIAKGISIALSHAYNERSQFFKYIGPNKQQPFIKKNASMAVLAGGSFGVAMNDIRKTAAAFMAGMPEGSDAASLLFDDRYTGNGYLYDLARSCSYKFPVEPEPMSLDDASVYIARWGGAPGMERFTTPYNFK